MDNRSTIGVKSIQSAMSTFGIVQNSEVLRENLTKCSDDEYEKNKCLEYIISADSSVKFAVPSDSLVDKIRQQVEFLFSDANVVKDKFLLKHMRRNKEGYVSLKLISSLRKVKVLSKDWRVVAYSLQNSKKLQMNSEMTKIRRIDPLPLPEVLDAFRTVLVFNYLAAYWTSETLKKQLRRFGTVESLVMVKSKADMDNADVKKTLALHERIATFPFAVVTFGNAYELASAVYQTSHPVSLLKIVPLTVDEIGVSKSAILSPVLDNCRRFTVKNREPNYSFNERKENQTIDDSKSKEDSPPLSAFRGDGPGNVRWIQRKNRNSKGPLGIQTPFMVILRQPKGPDGSMGFRSRGHGTTSKIFRGFVKF